MGKPLTVTRHGEVMGFYIPVKRRNEEKINRDLEALKEAIREATLETGLSQDELADVIAEGE
jgi:ribosome-binding protein aMBF1 (putative translation factor)